MISQTKKEWKIIKLPSLPNSTKMPLTIISPIQPLLPKKSPFQSLPFPPLKPLLNPSLHFPYKSRPTTKSCISNQDIEMFKTKQGTYTAKSKKVVILWDLDNKPPRGPPYEAALSLKTLAQNFGEVVDISAYANRHAFIHLPTWVVEARRESRQFDYLEKKGISVPSDPYICSVCGRKFKTNVELKKHFRVIHERERQKKMGRMRSLKGKKRQRFKERFIDGNEKYNEAARRLLVPKVGYGLGQELRRAGVFVKTVESKPQAADWALKRQMVHSMSRGVDWIVLVSDDSDFSDMLRKAREGSLGTVVVGDRDGALGRNADVWVSWDRVENGEIRESDLVLKRRGVKEDEGRNGMFSVSEFGGGESLDEIVGGMEFGDRVRVSSFSEGEEEDYEDEEGDYFSDSEDDELGDGNDDVYF